MKDFKPGAATTPTEF